MGVKIGKENVLDILQRLIDTKTVKVTYFDKEEDMYPISEKDLEILEFLRDSFVTVTYKFPSEFEYSYDNRVVDYSHVIYNGKHYLLFHVFHDEEVIALLQQIHKLWREIWEMWI